MPLENSEVTAGKSAARRCTSAPSGGFGELRGPQQRPQLHHSRGVDLADTRLGHLNDTADLFERQLLVVVEVQDEPIARRQRVNRRAEPIDQLVLLDHLVRTGLVCIVQQIAQRLDFTVVVAC